MIRNAGGVDSPSFGHQFLGELKRGATYGKEELSIVQTSEQDDQRPFGVLSHVFELTIVNLVPQRPSL